MADAFFVIPTASLQSCSLRQQPLAVLRYAPALRVTGAARACA
jgi:hypothetical protein